MLVPLFILALAGCGTPLSSLSGSNAPYPRVSLAVDPGDGSLLRAASGLMRSRDHGQTWQRLQLPADVELDGISLVAATGTRPTALYVGGPGAGIWRSMDGGQSWTTISGKLPSQDVRSFAVHTFRSETVYAMLPGQGVFRTEDAGGLWQKMDDGPDALVLTMAHSRLDGSMNTGWLYAGTADAPYLSMDCF